MMLAGEWFEELTETNTSSGWKDSQQFRQRHLIRELARIASR